MPLTPRKRRLTEAQRARAEAVARKAAILEAALDCIITMDHEGRIVEFNRAAESTFGHAGSAVVGKSLAEVLIPERLREAHRQGLARYLKTGIGPVIGKRIEMPALRADGTEFPIELAITRLEIEGPPLFMAFLRDLTERKRADEERERLVEELRGALRLNEVLNGALGHDLRTPLSAILATANLLLRRMGEVQETTLVRRILTSGERMVRMIDQLLDLTRVRATGTVPVTRRCMDLIDVCRQAIGELTAANPEQAVRIEPSGSTVGNWDLDRLYQVVSNLAGNALKHGTPDAPITVTVDGTAAEAVIVRVHNRGSIPPELLPHVFDAFRSSEMKGGTNGLGLGLYITQQIVLAHDGVIEVASSEPEGTTFSVRLPREPPR